MNRITNFFAGIVLFFLFSISQSFSQTIGFESLSNYQGLGLSYSEGGFTFSINDPGGGKQIIARTGLGYVNSTTLYDNNLAVGGINTWTIIKNDGTEFQFKNIYLQDAGFASTSGTIQGFKDGFAVTAKKNINFNGYKDYSSDADFFDVDEIRIEALDINFYLDHFVYGPVPPANTPPTASSFTAGSGPYENLTYAFSTANFGYSDSDGDPISHVLIESLPGEGTLYMDADDDDVYDAGEEVSINDQISKADLDAGNLQYIQNGSTDTSFQFEVSDGLDYSSGDYIATLNITPVPTVTLYLTKAEDFEGNSSDKMIQVNLSHSFVAPVTVNLDFGGTATGSGVDYSVLVNPVIINPGTTIGMSAIRLVHDALYEGDETITIDIASVMNGVENGAQQQTFTILEDDLAPTVSLEVVDFWNPITDESGGYAFVRGKIDAVAGTSITIPLSFSGTAVEGTDYETTYPTITLSPGQTMDSIRVKSLLDGIEEGDETIIIDMGAPTNAIKGSPDQVTLTIKDEDLAAPKDYTVEINQGPILPSNSSDVSFTFTNAEIDATYNYLFTSAAGGSTVSGSGTISSTDQTISNIDLSGLSDGTITLSVDLTDSFNNTGATVQDIAEKLASIPPFMTGVPTDITVTEGVPSSIDLSGSTLGDPDAAPDDVLGITYIALGGTPSFNPGVGITVSQPVPGVWTTSGTISDLNTYLSDLSSIMFTSNPGVIGDNAGSIDLIGNDGLVGASFGTVNIDVVTPTLISINDVTVAEGDAGTSPLRFTVSLDAPAPAGGATVDYATSDGTAIAGSDYTAISGTLSFAAGETSKTIDVPVSGDTEVEGSEIFTLTLSNPSGTGVLLGDAAGTGLIFNDDFKKATRIYWTNEEKIQSAKLDGSDIQTVLTGFYVGVRIDNINQKIYFNEVDGGIFKADLDGSNVETLIPGAEANGFALDLANNKIYWSQFVSGKIRRANLDGTIAEDIISSTNDPFEVWVDNFNNKLFWASYNNKTFSSSNLDGTNKVQIISGGVSQPWGIQSDALNGKVYFTDHSQLRRADLDGSNIESLSANGIPEGLDIDPEADKVYYGGSGIRIVDLDGNGDAEIIPFASSGTVRGIALSTEDIDVSVSVDDPSVTEGNSGTTTLTFTVSLDNPAPVGGATVDYATSDGSAIAGSDYTAISGTLNFAEGETSKTVNISVIGDETVEMDETLTLTLSNPTGTGVLLADGSGLGTIINDDQASVTIADVSVNESDGNATITAILDHGVQGGFSVDVITADGTATTADADYTAVTSQTLTFAGTSGESKTFQIPITDDYKVETDETVSISMSNLAGTTLNVDISDAATLTISNDDQASVTIADVSGNEDDGAITVTASLDNAVVGGFTVNVSSLDGTAIAGVDYTSVLTSLIFAGTAGETQAFTVIPTSDAVVEANETVLISMSGLVPSIVSPGSIDITDGAVVTILNDDVNAPSTPDLAASSDSGSSQTDNITNDLTPTFSGTALANSTVTVISSKDGSLGTTTANGSGNWTFTAGSVSTGRHTITATQADLAGNNSPASSGLSVTFDVNPPSLILKSGSTNRTLNQDGISPPLSISELLLIAIFDDYTPQGNIQSSLSKSVFNCSDVGTNSVTVTVTDLAGNAKIGNANVNIVDATKPTIQAKSTITLNVDSFGTVDLNVGMIDEGSTDNCGISSQVLSQTLFDRTDEGSNTVKYTVTDVNGNSSEVDIEVIIVVVPKVLNVTVDPGQSKVYGDLDPAFTYQASGFEGGDDKGIITGALSRDAGSDVGTYAIKQGSLDAGPNYTINYISADFGITPAALTVTADDKSKVYGETDPALSVSYSGFVNSDDETSLGGTLNISRAAGEDVGTYAITASGYTSSNYTISYTDGNMEITQAALTVTADDQSKVYGAADPSLTVSYSGFVNGDDATTLGGILDVSRAAGEDVGTYAITASGYTSSNYTISYTDGNMEITQAALTVTADDQSKVYGATDPSLTVSYSGFVNSDDATSLGGTLSVSRAAGEDVGTYAISASGYTSSNYAISYVDGNMEIAQAALTVTSDDQSKVYGSADPSLTVRCTGFVNGDDATALGGSLDVSRAAGEDVGTYAITASGYTSSNYIISYTDGSLEITQAALTVTADDQSKVYGAADPSLNVSYSGFVNGDDATALGGTLNISRATGEDVGTYAITASGYTSSNYTISYTDGNMEITQAALTVTADDQSKVYGAADPSLTVSYTGFLNGDDETALGGTLDVSRAAGENVGTYAISASGYTSGNYTISYTDGNFEIIQAALTVTADDQSKVYGASDPSLTVSYSGFVNGDDETALGGTMDVSRAAGEDVGTYAITASGYTSSNYAISYMDGSLAINQAALAISADDQSKVYGETDPALSVSYLGFVNGDDATSLGGTLDISRTTGEDVGTYAITASGYTSFNYTISYMDGNLEISQASLSVIADEQTKVYGTADPVLGYTASGFVNGDDENILTGSLSRAAGESIGVYDINLGSLSAGDNYNIVYQSATLTIQGMKIEEVYEPAAVTVDWGVAVDGILLPETVLVR
uniref:MBG domain-containing protein n=1 Tax=Echinicola shivajiensis TaxID=1035916 RepID=UPI001BFC8773